MNQGSMSEILNGNFFSDLTNVFGGVLVMGFSAIPISSLYPFLYFMVFYISFVLEAFKINLITSFETL
jgi:hypothetical protein